MMDAYRHYPATKESGVEWLGQIPAHWDVRRLKFVSPPVNVKLSAKPPEKIYLGLENIESGTGKILFDSLSENVESTVSAFQPGDVLFGKLRPYLAKVVHADFDGVCTTELLILRPIRQIVEGRFLFYLLLSHNFINIIDSMTYGAKMPRANATQIGNLPANLPPLPEQRAIAAFLDRETARIDALIARKRELIDLLGRQRVAVISHAVTKGLDPSAPLKDSGVEWLGPIPAHWDLRRLKFVTRFIYGDSLSAANREAGDVPVYGSNGIVGWHNSANTLAPCIVIGRKGSFGKVNYSEVPVFAIDTTFYIDKNATKENLRWLFYVLGLLGLDELSQDSAVPGLSREFAYNQYVPYPDYLERDAIAAFLDRETARIDRLIGEIETSIELLQRQRTALISAAVTGKIDVREQV